MGEEGGRARDGGGGEFRGKREAGLRIAIDACLQKLLQKRVNRRSGDGGRTFGGWRGVMVTGVRGGAERGRERGVLARPLCAEERVTRFMCSGSGSEKHPLLAAADVRSPLFGGLFSRAPRSSPRPGPGAQPSRKRRSVGGVAARIEPPRKVTGPARPRVRRNHRCPSPPAVEPVAATRTPLSIFNDDCRIVVLWRPSDFWNPDDSESDGTAAGILAGPGPGPGQGARAQRPGRR